MMRAVFHQTANGPLRWPTKRLRQWAQNNSITSIAALTTWFANNVTTLAQARAVLLELCICLVQMCNDGEAPPDQD